MKAALFLGTFLFVAILCVNAAEDDDGFKCSPGVRYQENKCNGCFCDSRHGLGCTLMGCSTHQDPKYVKCTRGSTWNEGCEQCWCTKQGTVCTTDCGKVHEDSIF